MSPVASFGSVQIAAIPCFCPLWPEGQKVSSGWRRPRRRAGREARRVEMKVKRFN